MSVKRTHVLKLQTLQGSNVQQDKKKVMRQPAVYSER